MARLYTKPYNQEYVIRAAETAGYIVTGIPTYEMRQDCVAPSVLFAGDLSDALDYIKQEIIKHDNWREFAEPAHSRGGKSSGRPGR